MKTVKITLTCRRDFMQIFPVEDDVYDVDVIDEARENETYPIELGMLANETDPRITVEVDGETVYDEVTPFKEVDSDPSKFEFVNVEDSMVKAVKQGIAENIIDYTPDDYGSYEISNAVSNAFEAQQICNSGNEIEDGQRVAVEYDGGYEDSATVEYEFEIDDNEEFDIEKLQFFTACFEDETCVFNCSATNNDNDIYLEDFILYGNKVIGLSEVVDVDYGDSERIFGEYYPGDCINAE